MTKTLASTKPDAPVVSRCPHCKKINPVIEVTEMGTSSDSVMVGFRVSCCKTLIGAQLIARNPETIQ